jgi:hypothetical protein
MIKKKEDAPGNPPYWYCTNCNWAFASLQESMKHSLTCGQTKEQKPAFQSFTKK